MEAIMRTLHRRTKNGSFRGVSQARKGILGFALRHWNQIEQGIFGTFIVSLISLLATLYADVPLI
jgi:hypothetical protein